MRSASSTSRGRSDACWGTNAGLSKLVSRAGVGRERQDLPPRPWTTAGTTVAAGPIRADHPQSHLHPRRPARPPGHRDRGLPCRTPNGNGVRAGQHLSAAGRLAGVGKQGGSPLSLPSAWSFSPAPAGLWLLQDLRRTLHDQPTQLPQRNSKNHAETGLAPTDSVAIACSDERKQRNLTSGHIYTAPGTRSVTWSFRRPSRLRHDRGSAHPCGRGGDRTVPRRDPSESSVQQGRGYRVTELSWVVTNGGV